MRTEFYIKSREEAEETARQLLCEHGKSGEETLAKAARDKDGGEVFLCMEDEETGNIVFFARTPDTEGDYSLYFLEAQEADPKNFTYPFRSLKKEELFFPLMRGAMFYKPTKEVTFDEAFSPEGAETLLSYMEAGRLFSTFCASREEIKETLTKEKAFRVDEWEEEDGSTERNLYLVCEPLPSILEELTGLPIKNAKDYAKGVESLIKRKLNKEERKEAEESYECGLATFFFLFLAYEFARTESYKHLQELLPLYKRIGLPEDWYGKWRLYLDYKKNHSSAEEQIVSIYLATRTASLLRTTPLRDIEEYTGIPYGLLLEASKKEGRLWN